MIKSETCLLSSSSISTAPYVRSCSSGEQSVPTRHPVNCRTVTPYSSHRIYYPVKEIDTSSNFGTSGFYFRSQKAKLHERPPVSFNVSNYISNSSFDASHRYYRKDSLSKSSDTKFIQRKDSLRVFYFDCHKNYEPCSWCFTQNDGLTPLQKNELSQHLDDNFMPAKYGNGCICHPSYERFHKVFDMRLIANNIERVQKKRIKRTPERPESSYSSSLNVTLQRHSHMDRLYNYDSLSIGTHQRRSQSSASDSTMNNINVPYVPTSYSTLHAKGSRSREFSWPRDVTCIISKANSSPNSQKKSNSFTNAWSTNDTDVDDRFRDKVFLKCNSQDHISEAVADTFSTEARIQIGSVWKPVQNLSQFKAVSTRVKPPLPPYPPSKSRLHRHSCSINEQRKQKTSLPLSQSFYNELTDGFQSNDQRRGGMRGGVPGRGASGGYIAGRTGITAAGTTPNVSGQIVLVSSKKKKSKKEKKSKLKKTDISNPTNFQHKAHVGWDANGGFSQEAYDTEFMDNSVRDILKAAGENPDRMTKDEIDFAYRFLNQYQQAPAAPPSQQAAPPPPTRRDKGQRPSARPSSRLLPQPPERPADMPPAPPGTAKPSLSSLPPVSANAPPPPPPPPTAVAAPTPSGGTAASGKGDLLSQIRAGRSLKPVSEEAPKGPPTRDDVMAQIRQGTVLKPVDKAALEERKTAVSNLEDIGGIAGALAKALKEIREKVQDSEESSEEEEENNEDEWASD